MWQFAKDNPWAFGSAVTAFAYMVKDIVDKMCKAKMAIAKTDYDNLERRIRDLEEDIRNLKRKGGE